MEQQPAENVYTQPYEEALEERMWKPEAGEELLEPVVRRDRILGLKQDVDGMLVAMSLSGSEVLRCSMPSNASVRALRQQIADGLAAQHLGVSSCCGPASSITVFNGARAMKDGEMVGCLEAVMVKEVVEHVTVFLCARPSKRYGQYLGEGSVEISLPNVTLLQVVREPLHFVTGDSEDCWLVYAKDRVTAVRVGKDFLSPIGLPVPPMWPLPPQTHRWGSLCDVWSTCVRIPAVTPLLGKRAAQTKDRPVPRYQMVVDPNQFVREDGSWVACEADISTNGSVQLVGGSRSHAQPKLASEVAVPVLQAALPLLARLRRPQLMLDRRRVQFVFKAQRIIVPPCTSDSADAEYVGLWHVDGHLEPIAAVVLYYYKVDPELQGGDMEFCGREPLDVLGYGDCSNNNSQLSAAGLREALRTGRQVHARRGRDHNSRGQEPAPATPRACKVPIREGTLLVFSNYQMVHRVLRMVNKSTVREASRDFVALFIVDPAAKPLVPARVHLARPYMTACTFRRAIEPKAVRAVLEFLGEVRTKAERRRRRAQLLRQQLQPQGHFGGNDWVVYATGNGCFTMIGWLDRVLDEQATCRDSSFENNNPGGWRRLRALNLPPEQLGRGTSELLSLDTGELEDREQYQKALAGFDMTPAIDGLDA